MRLPRQDDCPEAYMQLLDRHPYRSEDLGRILRASHLPQTTVERRLMSLSRGQLPTLTTFRVVKY